MATYKSIAYDPILANASEKVLLKTIEASSSANITFDTGFDSTYKKYIIKYIDVHPQTDAQNFNINFRDGSSAYDATKTTSFFQAYHDEGDVSGNAGVAYNGSGDVASGTGVANLARYVGGDNDQCLSGELQLFDPSNTTFVKQFIARTLNGGSADNTQDEYCAGYCNVTAAIDGVQFSMSSGNIDAGTFKLYGVK